MCHHTYDHINLNRALFLNLQLQGKNHMGLEF